MKRFLLGLIIIFSLVIGLWTGAQAYYTYFYPITGRVLDPDGVGTDSVVVVFYENDPDLGYADDLVGLPGLLGQPGQYAINAGEDYRINLVAGNTYHVASLHGSNGYGANPVAFTLTGQGYEVVPDLTLTLGGGIGAPAPQPAIGSPPRIENITFGNRKYQPALVDSGQQFIVASQPRISANAVSQYGVDTSSISMIINEGTATARSYSIASYITQTVGAAESPTSVSFTVDFLSIDDTLPEGDQNITFRASNVFGTTEEVVSVTVAGGEPRLIGVPITYPSPLNLKVDREVTFQYTLSHDLNTELYVFDVAGRTVLKRPLNARQEGGSAGINKVTWNLYTDQGTLVSSGIYVFTLVNRENGKLLGKGKFTALPQ